MQKKKLKIITLIITLIFSLLVGCGKEKSEEYDAVKVTISESVEVSAPEPTEAPTPEPTEEHTPEPTEVPTPEPTEEHSPEPTEEPEVVTPKYQESKLIVIDAGHQAKGNSDKEPNGPGATEMKAKVTGGATGGSTGQKEYELNLAVAFYLRDELLARGYEVIMVRESHDVNLSNSERAAIANQAGADAFIRIHANGSDNTSVSGTETLCQTAGNPYNASLYPLSRSLSEWVLKGIIIQTESKDRGVKETDTMSGINWCNVPTTIVEMGFLSNPTEDALMLTEEYRKKVAAGIANGIDAYFVDYGFRTQESDNQTEDQQKDRAIDIVIDNEGVDGGVVHGQLSVLVDKECVYTQDNELTIVSVNDTKWIDLDGDGEKELFVSFSSAVNSMPLEEWLVLKETAEGWKLLEMYHSEGNVMNNGFPIIVTLHNKDFDLRISCEGLAKEIPFDATTHYEQMKEERESGNNSYDFFMSDEWHQEGKIIGGPLAWGIWNIECGIFEGRSCLVAEHGLGGPGGKYDYYGNAYVYFDYDENGRIRILDLTFKSEF